MKLVRNLMLRFQEPIVVVSGLPRSGTSMAMKMLEAGGVEPFTDSVREADEDNPKGYYEFERVKKLHKEVDKSWMGEARGKAIKVISYLLPELPPHFRYKVIFMNRKLDEVMASQSRMLERRGEPVDQEEDEVKELFWDHLAKVRSWLRSQDNCDVFEISYTDAVKSPGLCAEQIALFVGRRMDTEKMAQVVDPALYRNRTGGSSS